MKKPKLSNAQILAELQRRTKLEAPTQHSSSVSASTVELILSDLYELQLEVIASPSKRKALLWGRRTGKTVTIRSALVKKALERPGSKCLFLAPTRARAESLLWRDLQAMKGRYSLPAEFNQVKLEMVFANGSVIRLAGCDTEADADKSIRGDSYVLVCVDEAGHIGDHLTEVIQRIINPTLLDHADSELWLSGTPNHHCTGYFFDKTKDVTNPPYGWAVWHSTMLDNPKLPRCLDAEGALLPNWQELAKLELADEMRRENITEQSPLYRREYLAEWYRDASSQVLRFTESGNLFTHLPQVSAWRCVLGVDVGFNHPFAVVVCLYSPETPNLYVVDAFAKSGLLLHQQIDVVRDWYENYKARTSSIHIVADPGGGGKFLLEDLSTVGGLPIYSPDKLKKVEHLELLSDHFHQNRIRIRRTLAPLIHQVKTIAWKDRDKGQTTEPDDLVAALLYAFRETIPLPSIQQQNAPLEVMEDLPSAAIFKEHLRDQYEASKDAFSYESPW